MIAAGTIIGGDFRIVEPLSEGGMGAVFVAEQLSTGRRRAVKLMKRELVADAQLRARFALEAKAGARIDSDHVVEVLAAGITDEGQPWLAMELLSGDSLHDLVTRRNGLGLEEARAIFGHVCHAVAAAHRVGIVHRDLKPENIFVANARQEGATFVAKVLDFGIAKVVADSQGIGLSQTASVGTPLWMAPEQADARGAITPATDLWPLGLIAFFMLTGKPYWLAAHTNGSIAALIREIAIEPLAPPTVRAAEIGAAGRLPVGFDDWFARCVRRNPQERFPSAEMAREHFFALQPVAPQTSPFAATAPVGDELALATAPTMAGGTPPPVGDTPGPAPPVVAPKRSSRLAWLLGGGAAVIATILVVRAILHRSAAPPEHEDSRRIGDEQVAQALRGATRHLPAQGLSTGALLALEQTDARWGADLPLVTIVFFCSFTEPACAGMTRDLDAVVADKKLHAEVRWRHAVPTGDASAWLAAEAAQGAFELGGTPAFLRFRDLVLAHEGHVTSEAIGEWGKRLGLDDPDDFVIRVKRRDWKARVEKDVAAYAAERIASPGFAWANCDPRGLRIDGVVKQRDELVQALIEPAHPEADLGRIYIERCKPPQQQRPALADVEVSPFAAVGSAEWAKKVALDWAAALAAHDVAALTATYAARVVVDGKEAARADVVKEKRSRFESEPTFRTGVADSILVHPEGGGYIVELTRAERVASKTKPLRTKLGIRSTPEGWAIADEAVADDTSCAAALLAALLDNPGMNPASTSANRLTAVSHELEMFRARMTIHELVGGRAMAAHRLDWDLMGNPAAPNYDPDAQPPPLAAAAIESACR